MTIKTMSGPLDGLTILRFAHAFATGGGMERILHELDNVLLRRNAATIVRMFIASDPSKLEERVELDGHGRLVLVPLALPPGENQQLAPDKEVHPSKLRRFVRDRIICHPLLWSLGTKYWVIRRRLRRHFGQVVGAGARFDDLAKRYPIDLCMMHYFGGADADEVIQSARIRGIPIGLQNHFANDRFLHFSIRKHALLSHGVSGMNALDVPDYLHDRFVNLADGIDTNYFDRSHASLPLEMPQEPVLFLPARIVQPKGQLDLVHAAARLCERGLNVHLVFAGRVESARFFDELNTEIAAHKLTDRVQFLGVLGPELLRDWYAASAILAFPTYHHEGLGRIIVEAQAMQVPVVAYATGGVPEGIIDGSTGFLVHTGDIEAMTNRIEVLLRDPELRHRMGSAGRQFVIDSYNLDALATRHESFYLNVIKMHRLGNCQ
jgi:glycosyltransferase involved in cell wall biosynthesis